VNDREAEFVLDEHRSDRLGFGEAVFCAGKSVAQISAILDCATPPMLLTRLAEDRFASLPPAQQASPDCGVCCSALTTCERCRS
jgi:NCAIR mutase (PurE)-related protein